MNATGTSIPLFSATNGARLRRSGGGNDGRSERTLVPYYTHYKSLVPAAPGVARRPRAVRGQPRDPRGARPRRRQPRRRYWTPSSNTPRGCAERRPPSCSSSTATCSASRESPARPRRSIRRYLLDHPIARNRSSTVGRAAEDMRTHQIADVLNDADYGRHDLQRLAGFRTLLSTPMILQDEVVGVLSMWRTDVAPFDDRERELLEEFAAQGAIVLRQVDLMRALESRGPSWQARSRSWRRSGRWARRSARASTSTRSWTGSSATPCGSPISASATSPWHRRRIDHGVRRVERLVPRPCRFRQQP